MEKNCSNCLKKETCTIINSCKERGYPHCKFYEGNGIDNKEKDHLISFEKAARPLIKWLCENEHPHVTAIITPTSCELLEGKCANPKIHDYVVD